MTIHCVSAILKGWERIVLRGEPDHDVIIAQGTGGWLIVNERFRRFCEEHDNTNCCLIPGDQAGQWF